MQLGIGYYNFISQIESGRSRIPPERYVQFAEAFSMEPKAFVAELMRYYDPVTYAVLFGKDHRIVPEGSADGE